MRGDDQHLQTGMFSYVALEDRIPADHPLRGVRKLVDTVLVGMSQDFAGIYSEVGRPSIAPERLLRAFFTCIRLAHASASFSLDNAVTRRFLQGKVEQSNFIRSRRLLLHACSRRGRPLARQGAADAEILGNCLSSSRFNSRTFTRGSPRNPH
jgi:hypothetical protein